jgi:N utilization substance protein B
VGTRRRARELVLQFLYQVDMNAPKNGKVPRRGAPAVRDANAEGTDEEGTDEEGERAIDEVITSFWESFKTKEDLRPFFRELALGVLTHRARIDAAIDAASANWKLSRMAVVDRNILRFSTYELLYLDDIPPSVTINEAIEIAKRFGTAESPSFINGILDNILNTRLAGKKGEV